ncbi:MAG: hypothetical protein LPK47_09320 [Bacteroidota bacterium]|nr:hypothetical protein [Bacteroidota bacterium]
MLRRKALSKRPEPGIFRGFKRSESILVVGRYPQDIDNVNHLLRTLEADGKKPEVFYFYPKIQKELSPPDHSFFTEKELNFSGVPSKGDSLEFARGFHDILIDVSGKDAPFPDFLIQFAVASIKAGRRDRKDLFQLVIQGESGTFTAWIDQLLYYLKIINDNV